MGMGYDDFCRLSPMEFAHVHAAYAREQEVRYRGDWERMRVLATVCAQPYSKKRLTPHALLPLPWDGDPTRRTGAPPAEVLTKDEALRRFEKMLHKARG